MKRLAFLLFASAVLASCADRPSVTGPRTGAVNVLTTLSDGAHGGNPYFYFLPPIAASAPQMTGTFDGSLLPFLTVAICPAQTAVVVCSNPTTVFTSSTTPAIAITDTAQYQVNWATPSVDAGFRIFVSVGATVLGYADVALTSSGGTAKRSALVNDTIVLQSGRTLPIKFSVRQGALCWNQTYCTATVISPDTQNVVYSGDDKALLVLPAGSWTSPLLVILDKVSPDSMCLPIQVDQPFGCYRYDTVPLVPQFLKALTLSTCADGSTATDLQLWKWHPETNVTRGLPETTLPQGVTPPSCSTGSASLQSGLFGRLAGAFRGVIRPIADLLLPGSLYASTGGPTVTGSSYDLSHVTPIHATLLKLSPDSLTVVPGATVTTTVEAAGTYQGNVVGLPNDSVSFDVKYGTITDGTSTGTHLVENTDQYGHASVDWTLPTTPGQYQMTVTLSNNVITTFTMTVQSVSVGTHVAYFLPSIAKQPTIAGTVIGPDTMVTLTLCQLQNGACGSTVMVWKAKPATSTDPALDWSSGHYQTSPAMNAPGLGVYRLQVTDATGAVGPVMDIQFNADGTAKNLTYGNTFNTSQAVPVKFSIASQ